MLILWLPLLRFHIMAVWSFVYAATTGHVGLLLHFTCLKNYSVGLCLSFVQHFFLIESNIPAEKKKETEELQKKHLTYPRTTQGVLGGN